MKKTLFIGFLIITISACVSSPSTGQMPTSTPEVSYFPTETPLPTPIPDTATPEPTPTPIPSPTPLPRFFNTQFDSSLTGWVILQAGSDAVPNIQTTNTALRMQMDIPYTWVYAIYGAQDYSDVHIETEFVNNGSSSASIGLICRYSEENGWLEYNVSIDGTYNVLYGRWLSVGVVDYLPVIDGTTSKFANGEPQRIGMTCLGTTLQLYMGETLIRNIDVSRFDVTDGKVGMTVSSFENTPVVISFNWVSVGEP